MKGKSYIIILALFIIGQSNAQVVIPCIFNITQQRGYECRLPDVDLSVFDDFIIGGDAHLPGQSDQTVVSFFSSHNNFRYFPTSHLQRFPMLNHIKITESLIEELPVDSVAGRPQLQTLVLSSNRISRIDPEAFHNTGNIRFLNLMFNEIRTLDNAIYSRFPLLIDLDLSFNLIERIEANALSNNAQLVSFNMNTNQVRFINQTFFNNVPAMSLFQFQNNRCYSGSFFGLELPANRGDMLNRLVPCFTEGPFEAACVFGFDFNDVIFNEYTCLLRGIEVYDMTREVNLGGFHLLGRSDPDVRFVWVHLSDTRFVISQLFTRFVGLIGLHITTSNLLQIQEDAFRGAVNLRTLSITTNNMRRLEANSFRYAVNLQEIFMWWNGIEYIHENAFAGLTNLRELHVTGGHLSTIFPNTFAPLPNLRYVDFSWNQLETVTTTWFQNNLWIVQLAFNNNLITSVHPNLIDMPLLSSLRLLNNICVNAIFTINDQTREQVRTQLNTCIENYPLRDQWFWMHLQGDLAIYWGNGTLVGTL